MTIQRTRPEKIYSSTCRINSVVHEVFDGDNPRHVGAAANIDIRKIDQDLMPCYSDLWPAA